MEKERQRERELKRQINRNRERKRERRRVVKLIKTRMIVSLSSEAQTIFLINDRRIN